MMSSGQYGCGLSCEIGEASSALYFIAGEGIEGVAEQIGPVWV